KGIARNTDTIHLFVNHWSSRWGGVKESEPKRTYIASKLKEKLESIEKKNKHAKIIMMGDFNDNPNDKSLNEILNASANRSPEDSSSYFNLLYEEYDKGKEGTYNYKGRWGMYDQFIVSLSVLDTNKRGMVLVYEKGHIFKRDWILFEDKKYKTHRPNKTYGGPNYFGGYSDHLPIYMDLRLH
ncbi:endonuclease/exonuclease/phosphatase family protein, partial [Candidatus Amoebophilus asiaticus]|nr:endonuclease/exonuclease/phosphatase family protein [Candidatus Amoebophilus asiaticus]